MIKTFEQFVLDRYSKPVNEGFHSGKLRAIIKQHGLPKNDWDKKMLYDLQDNEIIDVVDSRDEYRKYRENYDGSEEIFMIELEDGACVIIGNFDILKSYLSGSSSEKERNDLFKERHSERHVGNLGKRGGDNIHQKHLEKVDELEQKRLAKKLQSSIPEIVEKVQSVMDELGESDFENGDGYIEVEAEFGGDEYILNVYYTGRTSNGVKRYGAVYYDIYYTLESFEICGEETSITNDNLDITEKTYKDLFKEYTIEDVEGEIYDHYAYYGVSRGDFY